jgi:HSP20 family protein
MANIMKRNKDNGSVLAATSSLMPFSGWVDSVLQKTLNGFFDDDFQDFRDLFSSGQVPVNITETDKSYDMEVMAPGLRKDDFHIDVSGDMLTVSFEQKKEDRKENKRQGYVLQEYSLQSFTRSFKLDDTVDTDHIDARYRDGVLHISLPKKEGAQKITKSIEVK